MHTVSSLADATRSVEQALAKLGLLALTKRFDGDVADTPAMVVREAATTFSPAHAEGVTFRLDQIKVRGAGRRPTSLKDREITVVATWRVVAQHEDGTVTAVLAKTPSKAKGDRGKKRRNA